MRRIDPAAREPLYLQLADILRARIAAGELPPGAKIPSEPSLVQQYELGRTTVRHAIAVLRGEGLVTSVRGRGTRVREAVQRTVTHIPADAEVSARMPTEDERRRLGLPEGVPVLVVHRAGQPDEVLPADRCVVRFQGAGTPAP